MTFPPILSLLFTAGLLLVVRASQPISPSHSLFASAANESDAKAALQKVKVQYHDQLDSLSQELQLYLNITSTLTADNPIQQSASLQQLQQKHRAARHIFKRVEWLLAHRDEESVRRYVNGAPLPSVEQKIAEIRILDPAGFQALEELIFEPILDSAQVELTQLLSADLSTSVASILAFQKAQTLTHAQVWAATRYGLSRIFTLGLTGFDTPASGDAVAENLAAFSSIAVAVEAYAPLLDHGLATSIRRDFRLGEEMLTSADFDSFDRAEFYRKVIGPLYAKLLEAQKALGVELPDEVNMQALPQNYEATDLFADDFLNDFVFASQPKIDPLFGQKLELGKRLFYDVGLSNNRTLSCASCHNPKLAFSDGQAKSLGVDETPVRRNAPTLVGAIFAERYFADMREPELARQIRHVIQDEHEFATDYITLIDRLKQDESYLAEFETAYQDVEPAYRLGAYSVGDALASYVRSLHANASQVDSFLRREIAQLAPEVKRGFNLFMGKAVCGTCHFAPTFAGLVPPYYRESESEVLGIPTQWPVGKTPILDADLGRIQSGRPLDGAPFYAFSFKTPTVRNVALTAPYMHNGAIKSLGEVVEYYNMGGGVGLGLEIPHQTLPFEKLELSETEKSDLVSFMQSLTDGVEWK